MGKKEMKNEGKRDISIFIFILIQDSSRLKLYNIYPSLEFLAPAFAEGAQCVLGHRVEPGGSIVDHFHARDRVDEDDEAVGDPGPPHQVHAPLGALTRA